MDTRIIQGNDRRAIPAALSVLRSGGLVAFPTDTVYGLGALAIHAHAVERIYIVKGRPRVKAIPILVGELDDLQEVSAGRNDLAMKLAACFWPGALTLVVARHPDLPAQVSDSGTVGVRMPDHALARALLRAAGPMAVTSANLSDRGNTTSAADVSGQLGGLIELIVDGGTAPGGIPSTVVNCLGGEPVVLRQGPISHDDLVAALITGEVTGRPAGKD